MDTASIGAFLAQPRWAAACVVDEAGDLVASPVAIRAADSDTLEVTIPDAVTTALAAEPVPAALTADESETYEGIVGVILRGRLRAGGDGRGRFTIDHAAGFSFAGTLPPELQG
jgi:hypothetical protein